MAAWLLAVYTDCADPSREKEFNEWYDRTHLPDVLKIPGFVRATRYLNTDPDSGPGKFLARLVAANQHGTCRKRHP